MQFSQLYNPVKSSPYSSPSFFRIYHAYSQSHQTTFQTALNEYQPLIAINQRNLFFGSRSIIIPPNLHHLTVVHRRLAFPTNNSSPIDDSFNPITSTLLQTAPSPHQLHTLHSTRSTHFSILTNSLSVPSTRLHRPHVRRRILGQIDPYSLRSTHS